MCKTVRGASAGGKVAGGRGWPAEALACAHVAARQLPVPVASVQMSPHERVHACRSVRMGGCSHPLPRSLPVAPGGTQAVPRPLARVRCRRAPCEGRRAETPLNNAASSTAGSGPKGGRGLGGGPGYAAQGPSCPLGTGRVALQGCPGGVAVPCTSACPQQRQTHARTDRLHVPSSAGARARSSSARAGGGTGSGSTPAGALLHAGARARPHGTCPCTASLHAGNARAPGLHARTLPGTLAPAGDGSRVRARAPHACAQGAVLVPLRVRTRVCKARASTRMSWRPLAVPPLLPPLTLSPLSLPQAASSPATPSAKPR